PGASAHHGAHVNLPEMVANRMIQNHAGAQMDVGDASTPGYGVLGVNLRKDPETYSHNDLYKIGGPGAGAFGVRISSSGRVRMHLPSVSYLHEVLQQAAIDYTFKQKHKAGETRKPIPENWFRGFPGGPK
ncbi:MAG: hypothetical protein ACO1QB_07245, partial [Verrucomicrobiales bacterium]